MKNRKNSLFFGMVSKTLPNSFGIHSFKNPKCRISSIMQPITKRAVKFLTRISQTHFHTPLYISISLSPGCSRVWQVWKTAMSRSILLSQIFTGTPRTIFELVKRIIIHNIEMKNWHFTHHIKYLVYIKYISTLINMKKKKKLLNTYISEYISVGPNPNKTNCFPS